MTDMTSDDSASESKTHSSSAFLPLVRKFIEIDPLAAANTLEIMDSAEAVRILRTLPASLSSRILPFLSFPLSIEVIRELPASRLGRILGRMDPKKCVSLISGATGSDRERLIENLEPRQKKLVQELMAYPVDSVGRIMNHDYTAFNESVTVTEAINKLRSSAQKKSPPSYIYVIDSSNHLVGVAGTRDLIVAEGTASLRDVVNPNVFSLDPFLSREELLDVLKSKQFFAAPVVDAENHLLGVIRAASLVGEAQADAAEDIQRMFGVGGNEKPFSPMRFSLMRRLPWLHINLITAFMAAAVVALFEDLIAQITILAVFLPVVAGQGGNAGAQSLAVVMRGLVMREIPENRARALIIKETLLGVLNGVVVGIVTGLIAAWWNGNPYFGVVIGLAMIVNLMAAGFSGALIPLALKKVGQDPAQSSSIILTTVTDVVGFFAFLGIALLFKGHLI